MLPRTTHPRPSGQRCSGRAATVLVVAAAAWSSVWASYVQSSTPILAQEPAARPRAPRIPPLQRAQWSEEQRELLEPAQPGGRVLNITATLAHHPELLRNWLGFARYVLAQSTLPPRDRELLILRIGWLCQAEYEWAHHRRLGLSVGLSEPEIERIQQGPDAPGWSQFDRALLRAADELHRDASIGDATWAELAARYDRKQLLDVIFTVGEYNLVSMALNSLGVPLDEGLEGFDDTGDD